MALFSKKTTEKKDKKEVSKTAPVKKAEGAHPLDYRVFDVLKNPRITEKATFSAEKGVYVFDVATNATKFSIKKAIEQKYKVTPASIAVVNMKGKTKLVRGKWGTRASFRKAYVYLKKGDKIEII